MDQPTTTTQKNKQVKKSTTLKDTSTPRIIAHLVYRHRVGLLITSNIALIATLVTTAL